MSNNHIPMKYVGFCDILGFSSAVRENFEETIAIYQEFKQELLEIPFPERAQVSIYSDSILIVSDELPPVLHAVNLLSWIALLHDWLIRGGVTYGRYWEDKEGGNLFVVSDALVEAVSIEKSVKIPAVVLSAHIELGINAWIPRFQHSLTQTPVLHFQGLNIVNPFSPFWFKTAITRATRLLGLHPDHREKYEWFISLAHAVSNNELLIPDDALEEMLTLGILERSEGD